MMRYVILVALLLCLPVRGEAWQVVGRDGVAGSIDVTDDFNRTGPELGANWSAVGATSLPAISSGEVVAPTSSLYLAMYTGAGQFAANQKVCATMGQEFTSMIIVRGNLTNQSFYHVSPNGNFGIELKKRVNGTSTVLKYEAYPDIAEVCLSVTGTTTTTLTMSIDGVDKNSVIDTASPFTSGYPGIGVYNVGTVDNFSALELP